MKRPSLSSLGAVIFLIALSGSAMLSAGDLDLEVIDPGMRSMDPGFREMPGDLLVPAKSYRGEALKAFFLSNDSKDISIDDRVTLVRLVADLKAMNESVTIGTWDPILNKIYPGELAKVLEDAPPSVNSQRPENRHAWKLLKSALPEGARLKVVFTMEHFDRRFPPSISLLTRPVAISLAMEQGAKSLPLGTVSAKFVGPIIARELVVKSLIALRAAEYEKEKEGDNQETRRRLADQLFDLLEKN
jgi:hypothetical protein